MLQPIKELAQHVLKRRGKAASRTCASSSAASRSPFSATAPSYMSCSSERACKGAGWREKMSGLRCAQKLQRSTKLRRWNGWRRPGLARATHTLNCTTQTKKPCIALLQSGLHFCEKSHGKTARFTLFSASLLSASICSISAFCSSSQRHRAASSAASPSCRSASALSRSADSSPSSAAYRSMSRLYCGRMAGCVRQGVITCMLPLWH